MLDFDPRDLLHEMPATYYQRGVAYQREGRVRDISRTEPAGGPDVVTGRVRGSGNQVYNVYVELSRDPVGGLVVDGDCSCPVGFNCKHVAAVLLEAREAPLATPATADPLTEALTAHRHYRVHAWVEGLRTAAEPDAGGYPADVPQRLLYLLSIQPYTGAITVNPVTCRALKRGGYGKETPFNPARAHEALPPRVLLGCDVEILRLLGRPGNGAAPLTLHGEPGARALVAMLETGRCHWESKDSPALRAADPRPAAPRWALEDARTQRLVLHADPPATHVVPVAPPWYVDLEAAEAGPLDTGRPPRLAAALARAPEIALDDPAALRRAVADGLEGLQLPRPPEVSVLEVSEPPQPVLRLLASEADEPSAGSPGGWSRLDGRRGGQPPRARLAFRYGPVELPYEADPEAGPSLALVGDRVARVRRAREAERAHRDELGRYGLFELPAPWPLARGPDARHELGPPVGTTEEDEGAFWSFILVDAIPELQADGWRIEVDPDFDYEVAVAEAWYGELREGSERGWFDVELGVVIDGERVALLPLLNWWLSDPAFIARLREEPDSTVVAELPGGRRVVLPSERLRAVLDTFVELADPEHRLAGDRLRLSQWRALDLDGLDGLDWHGAERIRRLAAQLRSFEGIEPRDPPSTFTARLRPYQRRGLGWLQGLRTLGLGGILADDMGLGKTVQALAHLDAEREAGRLAAPSLVVAPTSLVANWALEAERFAPALRVLTLQGPSRAERFPAIPHHDLVITTYPLLHRDQAALRAHRYAYLILDEAQNIKNPRAKVSQAARALEADNRLCLTGTPLENSLTELWSLFHFLEPGLLGSARQFGRLFRTPIERQGDPEREAILVRRITPFLLRRTKDEVLGDLPDKTVIDRVVELDARQRDLYETIRIAVRAELRGQLDRHGLAQSHIHVLDALLKLRQVCCDPRLVKLEAARKVRGSAKLELLMDLLPEMIEEGRRVLLFSQFTAMLALIEEAVRRQGIDYVKLTGSTRDRVTPVRRFQSGEAPLFLISLKAGGTGLNLTAADTVIHYDPWWNPAVEKQASDRAHRIGQNKKVFVYRLLTAGTVEEKIVALQSAKQRLADAVVGRAGASGGFGLTADDLEHLLAPLG